MKLSYIGILAALLLILSSQALAADVTQVQMKDMKFQPAQVTIASGGTVTWTNLDPMLHDVKFKDFESHDLKKGEQYTKTFDKPGTYDYICEIHPGMKGTVIVT